MWLLVMVTISTTSIIGEFNTEQECKNEAREYRAYPSPSRDVFYCKKVDNNGKT